MNNLVGFQTRTQETNPARLSDEVAEKQRGADVSMLSIPAGVLLLSVVTVMAASGAFFNGYVTSQFTQNSAPLPVDVMIETEASSRVGSEGMCHSLWVFRSVRIACRDWVARP